MNAAQASSTPTSPDPRTCCVSSTSTTSHSCQVTYAAVVKRPPAPPDPQESGEQRRHSRRPPVTALMGRPQVSLPVSQLVLGRMGPPWYASAWHLRNAATVSTSGQEEGQALRVTFPKGAGTPGATSGPQGGGGFFATPRCLPARDVTLHYTVRFARGFVWSRGGKLPGLFIGDGAAAGGKHSTKSASCRLMWQPSGGVIAYVYPPEGVRQSAAYAREAAGQQHNRRLGEGDASRYGDALFKKAGLRLRGDGQWNRVVLRVKLNSFDDDGTPMADGVLSLVINDRAATFTGVVWRRFKEVRISHLFFSTFYGGSWTCPETTYADFADFRLTS